MVVPVILGEAPGLARVIEDLPTLSAEVLPRIAIRVTRIVGLWSLTSSLAIYQVSGQEQET
jgi:hypothetical protein